MSNYLAGGGDSFTVFAQVPHMLGGGQALDALEAYFRASSPLAPPATNHMTRIARSAPATGSNQ